MSRSKEVNEKMVLTSKDPPKNRYKNIVHKINTANFIVMSNFKDGSDALREQLTLSFERMKASKNCHEIKDNLKNFETEYYSSNKNKYLIDKKAQLIKIMKEKEDIVFDVLESTGNFNGKKPYKC